MSFTGYHVTMYHELLQVAPRTSPEKVPVFYARDHDWNPLVVKGPLSNEEINALIITERIKELLGLPRTNVRRSDGNFVVSDCLYEYSADDFHICKSGIDKGKRLSNTKLKMWRHDITDKTTIRSFFKAVAFRHIIGTDDTVPRNFILIDQTVYSIDDPAWEQEPTRIWKVKNHSEHYNTLLDENWEWVMAFLTDWKNTAYLSSFAYNMIDKLMDRSYWNF
jgi:hypothetical protein